MEENNQPERVATAEEREAFYFINSVRRVLRLLEVAPELEKAMGVLARFMHSRLIIDERHYVKLSPEDVSKARKYALRALARQDSQTSDPSLKSQPFE